MNDRNPTDIRGQDAERDETEAKKRIRKEQERDDLKAVMATRAGRRFVWRLLAQAGIARDSGSLDPYVMAYEKGARIAGLELLLEIDAACPERYDDMKREQRNGR